MSNEVSLTQWHKHCRYIQCVRRINVAEIFVGTVYVGSHRTKELYVTV